MPKDDPRRRSPRKHGQAKKKPAKVKKQAEEPLPRIDWDADKSAATYDLIAQMEVKENRLVLFGKQGDENTSGESKIAVYKRIGSKIFPAMYSTSPNALGKRVKGKADSLVTTYKKHAKKLQVTGGGLRKDDEDDSGDVHEFLECYISSEGPDHDTTVKSKNLWDEIKEEFEFFPHLHRFLAARSNIVPPMIATGVGPEGRKVVHLQPPAGSKIDPDANIDPTLMSTPHRSRQDSPSSPIEVDSSPLAPVSKHSRGRTAARPSTFQGAAEVKSSKYRTRKSFEESIVDIQTKMMRSANNRENLKVENDRARLRLDENNQLLALFNAGILDKDALRKRLDIVEARYADPPKRGASSPVAGPSKQARTRSRSSSSSSSSSSDAQVQVGTSSGWDRNGHSPAPGSDRSLGYR